MARFHFDDAARRQASAHRGPSKMCYEPLELGDPLPKTQPLPGSLHVEFKKCGKGNCRCSQGHLHGPYIVRHWIQDGRQRKAYVKRQDVEQVRSQIELWKALNPSSWPVRQTLADLRQIEREVRRCLLLN